MRLAAVLLVGAIAALLDTTIVNVAIETIGRDLHAPLGEVQWVMTGYLLSYGMVIPLSGWALARFGGRATWMTALSVFLAASVAAGGGRWRSPPWRCCPRLCCPAAQRPGSRAAGPVGRRDPKRPAGDLFLAG
jgi:MFS family permease